MRKLWENIRPHLTVGLVVFLFVVFVFSILTIRSERADHRQDLAFARIEANQKALTALADQRQIGIENRALKDYNICRDNKTTVDALSTLLKTALSNAARSSAPRTDAQQRELNKYNALLDKIRPVDCGPKPLTSP